MSDTPKSGLTTQGGIYRIRDVSSILSTLVITIALTALAFFLNRSAIFSFFIINSNFSEVIALAAICNIILIASSYRLNAVWDGVRLDLNNNTIEFGGGGVSANDMSDYLKPSYLLQYFKRTKINLDEVSHLEQEQITTRKYNKTVEKYVESTKHYIKVSGTFGSASIPFSSEGKCTELYSAIRQINRMGTPFFKA